jgi:hypothetical protein
MALGIVLTVFLVSPLACWALLARTKVLGWTFAGVLAGCAATEGVVAAGWIFRGEKVTLVTVLTVVTAAVLIAGGSVESREPDVPRRWGLRGQVGIGLAILFYVLCGLAGLVYLLIAPDSGLISVPPTAQLLPLGPGLTVTNSNGSCSQGSATICDRWIYIHRTAQVPEQDALARMRTRLAGQYGLDLAPDGSGGWGGCTGDRQQLCGQVDPDQDGVVIVLEASDECEDYGICQKPPYSFGTG